MDPILSLLVVASLQKTWPSWIGTSPSRTNRSYTQSTTRMTTELRDPMDVYMKLYGSRAETSTMRVRLRTDGTDAWPKWIGRPRVTTRPQSLR